MPVAETRVAEPVIPETRSFEPELVGPSPRPIPDDLRRGPYEQRRRKTEIALVAAGLGCLAASRAPGLETLALYVLPLGYLGWIGLGLIALAAVGAADRSLRPGPYRYVKDGVPLPAVVRGLLKAPSLVHNGQPSHYAFNATLAVRHPETREAVTVLAKSRDFAASKKDHYETPFRVGDEVTVVYLPGRFEKSARLYAFLDLNPFLALSCRAAPPSSPWAVAGLLVAVPALFTVLFANLYAFGRYHPIGFEYRRGLVPMIAGGVLIGGAVLFGLVQSHRAEQRRVMERNQKALLEGRALEPSRRFLGEGPQGWLLRLAVAAGSILIGALTALCWAFLANAWGDASPPRSVPAEIRSITATTHAFLFREYEIEYRLAGSAEELKLLTTPEEIRTLAGACAVALTREGRLGWRWVERLQPVACQDGSVALSGSSAGRSSGGTDSPP